MNGNAVSLGGVCIEWHISLATRNGDTNYQLVRGKRTTVVNEVGAYKDLSSFLFTPCFPLGYAARRRKANGHGVKRLLRDGDTVAGRKRSEWLWVGWRVRAGERKRRNNGLVGR